MTTGNRRWIGLSAGLALLACALAAVRVDPPMQAGPWLAPELVLGDQHGRPVDTRALRGHVWIADFIFTTCTSVCPMLTARMRILQRRLPDPALRFVSFSVDPVHDTTEALRDYAQRWAQHETRWHLLRTQPESLQRAVDGLRVIAEPTRDPHNPILHTSLFFVVDAAGRVHGMYDSNDDRALDRLVADVQQLTSANAAPPFAAVQLDELGCAGCHDHAALAPALSGLWGQTVMLADGTTATADAAYLRESIVTPAAKLVAGYPDTMPSYASVLSNSQIDSLVSHLQRLSPSASAAAALPSASATDPVCGMSVHVVADTPHVSHGGHDYFFCSAQCRARFSAAH